MAERAVIDLGDNNRLVAELVEARKRGELRTAAETRAWLYDRIDGDEDRRDAVHCTPCLDTGTVTVVSQFYRGRDGSWSWSTAAAACGCEAGRRFKERPKEESRLPAYDEYEHVRVIPMATEADVRAEYLRVRERRAQRNRVVSFDEFNQRGASDARDREREEACT